MAVIEIVTFELAPDVDEGEFVEADRRAQTEFLYRQPGLLRRTTARSVGDEWLVVTLWGSPHDVDTSVAASRDDPAVSQLTALMDSSSITTRRYETLD
jgi:polyisoprenoid-binding protein YceI